MSTASILAIGATRHLSDRNVARFERIGAEDETSDFDAGHSAPITRDDLASALAGHYEADLAALSSDDERAEAVEVMVAAYVRDASRRGRTL